MSVVHNAKNFSDCFSNPIKKSWPMKGSKIFKNVKKKIELRKTLWCSREESFVDCIIH